MTKSAPEILTDTALLESIKAEVLDLIRSDSPDGFELYFTMLFNRPFPPHAKKWVEKMYKAHADKMGYLEKAFRYSWKTTVLTVAFLSYRVGLEPNKTNLIIQVKDENAEGTAAKVRDIIATSPVFRLVFPHVVPDEKRGWANRGYFVKRNDMDYGEWLRQCGTDPTFVGYGYTSSSIIGKHPNGCLIVDDIHDENNTASVRELQSVIDIITGTIYPTRNPRETWVIFVGTPWVKNDALGYSELTGFFECDVTPIYTDVVTEHGPVRVYTWPEEYGEAEVESFRKLYGPVQFARMCLCDISAMDGLLMKKEWLMEYPGDRVKDTWPVYFGVDWASLGDPKTPSKRDYFALAVGVELPGGGIVVVDGVNERLTSGEAVKRMTAFRDRYPTLQAIGFERLGKGEEAFNTILYTTNLPLVPQTVGNKSKRERYKDTIVHAFQTGRMKVSDVPNPYLAALKMQWLEFDFGDFDDILDSLYHLAKVAIGALLREDDNAKYEPETLRKVKPTPSPWKAFGRENR